MCGAVHSREGGSTLKRFLISCLNGAMYYHGGTDWRAKVPRRRSLHSWGKLLVCIYIYIFFIWINCMASFAFILLTADLRDRSHCCSCWLFCSRQIERPDRYRCVHIVGRAVTHAFSSAFLII